MPKHAYAQFDGLFLGINPKQAQKPGVITGTNFYINAEGVKSAFANSVFCYDKITAGVNFDSFAVDDEHFLFTEQGIYTFDLETKSFIPQYKFTSNLTDFFPWSKAHVGGKWYFIKQNSGLIEYDPVTKTWSIITTSVPTGAVSCCEAGGRLIVLGQNAVAWSELDNGANLVPNVSLGIATQSLAIVGGGSPLAVKAVSEGFVVYTTRGKLFAQIVDLLVPFRVRPIRDQIIPVSPWALTELDETTHIILTISGLYTIDNFQSQPFLPLLSEHLREKQFNVVKPTVSGTYRIFYDDERQLFFLSISQTETIGHYDFAYCIYVPTEKVGQFNYRHSAIFQLPAAVSSPDKADLGFIGTDGYIRYVTQNKQIEVFSGAPNLYTVRDQLQFNPRTLASGVVLMPTFFELYAHAIPPENTAPGVYELSFGEEYVDFTEPTEEPDDLPSYSLGWDDDTLFTDDTDFDTIYPLHSLFTLYPGKVVPPNSFYNPIYTGPGSAIELGPFRILDAEHANRLQEVNRLTIGAAQFGESDTILDCNTYQPNTVVDGNSDDFNIVLDGGVGIVDTVRFSPSIRGSIDGRTTWNDNIQTPEQIAEEDENAIYTARIQGVYTSLIIEATETGESFHIKTVELDVKPGAVYKS